MRRLPYRTRLMVAYTAIIAVALLAFSAIAYAMVQWSLAASTAARLETTASAIRGIPDVKKGRIAMDGDDRRQFLALLSDNHVNGAAFTDDGALLFSSLGTPPSDVIAASSSGASRDRLQTGATTYSSSQPIRGAGGKTVGSVLVWDSRIVNQDAARITLLSLLATSFTIIVVAAIVGGAVIRGMLAPITDLSTMMSEIEAADLGGRLAWDGPDDELGRLCSTFDRLLDRLQSAFDLERRFTADASHELRTPLSVMRAEVELSLSRERDAEAYRATLERLQLETNRMEALVESLLLTARGDAGLAAAAPLRLRGVAERAARRLEQIAAQRGVALHVEAAEDVAANADANLLESALVAVLDNALRYTPAGGSIRIAVTPRDGWCTLAVLDGGPGFGEAALRHGTQRFWRDDPSRSGAGTGLGLAIVAAVAARHGGTVTLRNAAQGGVVEIRLPALMEGPTPIREMDDSRARLDSVLIAHHANGA
jgi:two-component system OmpR family sensor kinase